MRKGLAIVLALWLLPLVASDAPVTFAWPDSDSQGSLRLRFRLADLESTFALPARSENRLAQSVLLDTPRFRVNLNVDKTKTSLHFFVFAESAVNGAWALSGVERLEGRPDTPCKVGVVDLSHLKGGRDYELWINWNLSDLTLAVWLNGELQGDPFTANRQPWVPAARREGPARASAADLPLRILAVEAFSPAADEARILASAADLARLENEGRVVFHAPLDLDAYTRTLRYAPDLSNARIVAEASLFNAEGKRVRASAEDEWVLEGEGRASATPGGLHLDTRPEGDDTPEITATTGNLVLWAPVTLPENFLLEYDFEPESSRRGLHILFWNALARGGADIFAADSGLPLRKGLFFHYTWRGVNSYHASLFATDDEEPRRVANLRKNSGFVLAACGDDAIYGSEGPVRIRLLRDGALMRLEANGREVMRYTDDGKANGPPLQGGRFGFRIMAHTGRATISNLKLFELHPVSIEAEARSLLDFNGLETAALPGGWRVEGDKGQSHLHKDPLVEGRGYLRMLQSDDAPTTLRIPVPVTAADGRMTLRMNLRSPQSKWLQLSLTRNGERFWSHNLALGRHWKEEGMELEVRGTRVEGQERQSPHGQGEKEAAELSLSFHGEGGVDLETLSLRFQDSAAVAESLAVREVPGHAGNLLRNSRLPLGLPSGWHLDRNVDDEIAVKISSGSALHLKTKGPVAFFSEPFSATRPGRPHTAAFSVQGAAEGHAQVFQDGRPLSERVAFTASEDLQTVKVPFSPAALARLSTLRIEIDGKATFDDFAVFADAHPPGARAEVALAVPRFSRVVFHDEPLTLTWTVSHSALRTPHSALQNAVLRARVVNLYGDEANLAPVALSATAPAIRQSARGSLPRAPAGAVPHRGPRRNPSRRSAGALERAGGDTRATSPQSGRIAARLPLRHSRARHRAASRHGSGHRHALGAPARHRRQRMVFP